MPMLNNFQIKFKLITLYLNKHFMKKIAENMGIYKNMQKWCKDIKSLIHASKYNEILLDGDN